MSEIYRRRLLEHLADTRYRPRPVRELAEDLGIDAAELEAFEQAVGQMIEGGQVLLTPSESVALPPPGRSMIGTLRLNPRGFGFLVPDDPVEHGDLFIPAGSTADAVTGDRVRAAVIHDQRRAGGSRSPYVGKIVEVLQRAERRYAGNLEQRGSQWVVRVDGQAMAEPVVVRDVGAKNASAGDKVVIEIVRYPVEGRPGEGVITEVLGEKGQPDIETLATMRVYGLPETFHPDVVRAARAAADSFDPQAVPPDREDLTGRFILTIDPPDARDFDDAIHIVRDDKGWELGVHIADVSHFVKQGEALDKEAAKRGNSVYLPRRVVPMLPELLSNGVCSLQEGVNRFCKSAFIRFDHDGKVQGARFSRSVIRSVKRLTYIEAQALIDGDLRTAVKHAKTEPKYPSELIKTLRQMDELAKIIRQRRLRDGMIVLALPEVELVFDDSGRVADAQPEDTSFTHTLIEMFMVEANEAAARLFDSYDVPMVRRIHPDPDAHDVGELKRFARVAGFNIPARPSRKELQQLLDSVRGKPQQRAVHVAVLRTLSKAEYSPLLIGHFALASEHYTHFTSPIRRYADLVVHRGLDAYIEAAASGPAPRGKMRGLLMDDHRLPDIDRLSEISRHCSATERNAESAERDLRTYLVLELLAKHLGDDFAGTVTGVTGGGIFVQLDKYLVDGFVRAADLPGRGDRWRLNGQTGAMVSQRSGRTIAIGDTFTVRIARVDTTARKLDVVIVEDGSGSRGKGKGAPKKEQPPKRTQPPGAKKAGQEASRLRHAKKTDRRGGRKRGRR